MIESLLSSLDRLVGFLPAALRLALWGTLGGAGAMLLYARLSPQREIGRARRAAHRARRRMASYKGTDFRVVWRLARRSVALAWRQLALVAVPAMLAALPVIVLVTWVDGAYSHRLPSPGETVRIRFPESSEGPGLVSRGLGSADEPVASSSDGSTIRWPGREDEPVPVFEPGSNRPILTLPLSAARPTIRKRCWWHWLWANPAGYLTPDATHELVRLDLPERRILRFGDGWSLGWQTPLLVSMAIAALATKFLFRVH